MHYDSFDRSETARPTQRMATPESRPAVDTTGAIDAVNVHINSMFGGIPTCDGTTHDDITSPDQHYSLESGATRYCADQPPYQSAK